MGISLSLSNFKALVVVSFSFMGAFVYRRGDKFLELSYRDNVC